MEDDTEADASIPAEHSKHMSQTSATVESVILNKSPSAQDDAPVERLV